MRVNYNSRADILSIILKENTPVTGYPEVLEELEALKP